MQDKVFNKKPYKERRQELRNNCTDAEQALWQRLKGKQLGVKFRRQHGIGNYIVDFYCPSEKLAIELDGSQHYEAEGMEYDKERTAFLQALDITVKRYDNRSVLTQTDAVVADILTCLPSIKRENLE